MNYLMQFLDSCFNPTQPVECSQKKIHLAREFWHNSWIKCGAKGCPWMLQHHGCKNTSPAPVCRQFATWRKWKSYICKLKDDFTVSWGKEI